MEQKFIPHPEYTFDQANLPDTEDAVILIDKPAGISSFGVVAKIRGALKQKFGHKVKIGHTGTLDPFATGLLILLSGKMTKKSNEFLKKDKTYEATLKLGYTSTTGDPEGEIQEYPAKEGAEFDEIQEYSSEGGTEPGKASSSAGRPWRQNNAARENRARSVFRARQFCHGTRRAGQTRPELNTLESTLQTFVGEITQTPPVFSAIKINGERAYKLARKGEDFEIPSRKVTIYSIEILDYNYPELKIRTHVSSGTYIRTLAEDIGKALKTGAYLTALRRTEIDKYQVKDAKTFESPTI